MHDEKPAVVFSCSCKNAKPEDDHNLGKSMLLQGSIGFIGATHDAYYIYGWESEKDGGAMTVTYYFFDNFLNNHQSLGQSLYNTLTFCWEDEDIFLIDPNIYVFTLYGDPSLSLQVYQGLQTPDNPDKPFGSTVLNPDVSYDFSTRIPNANGDFVYYIWDFGDGVVTEPIGPYLLEETVTVSHSYESPGEYRI
jgi:hypothetical protein